MRFLLDTHVWLWSLTSPERLSATSRAKLEEEGSRPVVSVASLWEVAIKATLGKLKLPSPPEAYLPTLVERSGVEVLAIGAPHVLEVARLPWLHRDPFDRMLVAQARAERLAIMTADEKISAYEVETLAC